MRTPKTSVQLGRGLSLRLVHPPRHRYIAPLQARPRREFIVNDSPDNQILVDRVDSITCASCGRAVDLAKVKPLTTIDCPGCGARVAVPGQIGQYMVTRVMGAGAMGAVFAATDTVLGRRVAIKVMRPQQGADDKQAQLNFLREARALASVNHPNVVQVHTIGQHKGQTYIVMELVDGEHSLEADVTARRQLDEQRALEIGRDVAEGLATAYRMKLVHGDVKPGNILIATDNTAKVVDFGLVQRSGQSDDDQPVWGTPYYVAPERIRGEPPNAATDIYSLGATLWHLLAGKPPFAGSSVKQVINARLKNPPPDLADERPDLSRNTVHIVMKMMAQDPAERYPDYDTIVDRLDKALKNHEAKTIARASRPEIQKAKTSTKTRRAAATDTRRKPAAKKKSKAPLIISVVVLLTIGALAAGLVYKLTRPDTPGDQQQGDPTLRSASFDGPKLPSQFTAIGEGAFNQTGQYILTPAADQTRGLRADLPPDGFVNTIQLNPIEGFVTRSGRAEITYHASNGDGLTVVLTRSDDQGPILRATITAGGESIRTATEALPYAPQRLTLRVQYTPRFSEWSLRYGLGTAQAITAHPIGRIVVPETAKAPEQFQLTVETGPGTGKLSLGIDEYDIEPSN